MKHPIIEEIKKEFYLQGLLNKEAELACICDGIVTFQIWQPSFEEFHELCIICKDPTFYNGMTPADILSTKNITFLSHSIFIKEGNEYKRIGESKYYRALEHGPSEPK